MDKHDKLAYEKRRGKLKGKITIIEHRDEGDVTVYKGTNLITNDGLQWFIDRAVSDSPNVISHVAIGDDTTTPDVTDTALNNEVFRKAISSLVSANNIMKTELFVSATEALFTWKEIGMLNAVSAGVLVNHLLLDYIHTAVDVTVILEITSNDDGV